jgi:tetratricopeptide (TPR) repeat protein
MATGIRLAAAGLLLSAALLAWYGSARAETRVSAECGVAARGDIIVGDSISIICTPRELLDLIHEQQAFRDIQTKRIAQIAAGLDVSSCRAEELLAAVARQRPPVGEIAAWLTRLARERRSPGADQRDIQDERGLVGPDSIETKHNLIIGIPPEELDDLLTQVRNVDDRYLARIERLGQTLGFTRCATATFLAVLGQEEVPPEQLSGKLTEIANGHLRLEARLRSLTTPDPRVRELRDRAAAAIADGDYQGAHRVLREAGLILEELTPAVAPLWSDQAAVSGLRADLELGQLHYVAAAEILQQAANQAEAAGRPGDQAAFLGRAGGAYQDAGLQKKAEVMYEGALQCLEDHPGAGTKTELIITWINLGGLHFAQSDYTNAAKRFAQALEAARQATEVDSKVRVALEAASHSGLADAGAALNEFETAETHYLEAVSLLEREQGKNHPSLVPTITNWAWLKTMRGEYEQAESLYLRAVAINDARGQAGLLEAAATKSNLAGLYFKLHRYEEAETLWTQVQDLYTAQLGADHIATLILNENIAKSLVHRGDLAAAERLYDHALAVWEERAKTKKQVEKTHLVIASLYGARGDLYARQKRYGEATKQYDKAISLAQVQFGDDEIADRSLAIAGWESDRAVIYERLGRLEDALVDLERARRIMATRLDEGHPDYGTVTSNLARVLAGLGRLDEAVPLYRAAIAVAEKARQPTHVAARSRSLAGVYKGLGKHAQARRYLEASKQIYQGLGPKYAKQLGDVELELAQLGGG